MRGARWARRIRVRAQPGRVLSDFWVRSEKEADHHLGRRRSLMGGQMSEACVPAPLIVRRTEAGADGSSHAMLCGAVVFTLASLVCTRGAWLGAFNAIWLNSPSTLLIRYWRMTNCRP